MKSKDLGTWSSPQVQVGALYLEFPRNQMSKSLCSKKAFKHHTWDVYPGCVPKPSSTPYIILTEMKPHKWLIYDQINIWQDKSFGDCQNIFNARKTMILLWSITTENEYSMVNVIPIVTIWNILNYIIGIIKYCLMTNIDLIRYTDSPKGFFHQALWFGVFVGQVLAWQLQIY